MLVRACGGHIGVDWLSVSRPLLCSDACNSYSVSVVGSCAIGVMHSIAGVEIVGLGDAATSLIC